MNNVFVVGSINRDLVAYTRNLPRSGETVFGHAFQQFPGGKGANQAVAASRLGGKVDFVGSVGVDAFGDAMLHFLAHEHIGVRNIKRMVDVPTGIALITLNEAAENMIVVISGANMAWQTQNIASINIAPGDIVVCQFEIPLAVIEQVFTLAKNKGAVTILNPAPIQTIPQTILGMTDYLVLNEIELSASACMPIDVDKIETVKQAAHHLQEKGVKVVVATLGAHGVLAVDADSLYRMQGHHIEAVDSTGAGDCFIGAFAAALSWSTALKDALEFANKAASISVTRQGASPSYPTYEEVNEIIQSKERNV